MKYIIILAIIYLSLMSFGIYYVYTATIEANKYFDSEYFEVIK